MNIVILGATGKTGQLLVREALKKGYQITAYVRNPETIRSMRDIKIVQGSVEDQAAMQQCFVGADAVISCLGTRPSFKALCCANDFQQRSLPKIIAAINEAKVKRFVLMSSFGIGKTKYQGSWFLKTVLYSLLAKRLFDDKAKAEQALDGCQANWTAVYPVILQDKPAIKVSELVALSDVNKVPGIQRLPFANVAKVLADLAAEEGYSGQKLLLTTQGGWC